MKSIDNNYPVCRKIVVSPYNDSPPMDAGSVVVKTITGRCDRASASL